MNMQNIMAQANKMKKDIEKKQEEIDNTIFESSSGAVNLKMTGKREIKELKINKSILKDEEDLEALEDMITIAFSDANKKIDVLTQEKLGMYGTGLNGLL